jgi:CMP-N,N'-diacetyllegionaminic acid synthase
MIAGLILARGGSRGIPRKNVRELGGKPLINWTIEAALRSKLDAVYVTTEDEEISAVAWNCVLDMDHRKEFRVYPRPSWLAQGHVQSDEVFLALYRQLQENDTNPTALVMLPPTSPFRTEKHIDEAIDLFYRGCETTGLTTVVSCYVADGFYWKIDEWHDDSIVPVYHDPVKRQGRQWIPRADKLYRENGAIYVADATRFGLERSYRLPPYVLYEMDEHDSIDLDTLDDWAKAEQEMKRRQNAAA